MTDMKNPELGRRSFLKKLGAATAVVSGASLYGCSSDEKQTVSSTVSSNAGKGEMTYRIHPTNGDKVSILGYGCMRWPMKKNEDGKDIVDHENVKELIDHALANGVNYIDTAPVYLQGQSEAATGIA